MSVETDEERMLNLSEAAALLGVSTGTLRECIRRGDIQAYRLGDRGHIRLFRSHLSSLLQQVAL